MRLRWFLFAVATAMPPAAPAQTPGDPLPPPVYSVYDDARTGSRIARKVVTGSAVPLNRSYAQLTAAEKELVRSQYEAMAAGDEPPFPLDGLLPLESSIQKIVQATQVSGELALLASVDASGRVTKVEALRPADPVLVQRAASVLVMTRFKPAVCGGQACAMGFPYRVTVHLTP